MNARVCPECLTSTTEAACPRCGTRTVRDRRAGNETDPVLGKVLDGRYRIDAVIGRGGMGSVYKALHLSMGKAVAVKVIKPELASDLDAVRRFQREAKAASLLSHPNTIRVFDFGESEDGLLYLVMEHLEGRTLAQLLAAEGALPEARALHITLQVARALAEAHAAGMVHRDLKPQNVMLIPVVGDQDFVKVLDFGIVKFLSESGRGSQVTRTGMMVGSPHYMAPEQARSERPDARADIYSLGVVLHEMLAGRRPFESESPMMVLLAHLHDPVPPIPDWVAVGPATRDLVARLTAKDPSVRPATALEVIALLAAIPGGEAMPAAPGPARPDVTLDYGSIPVRPDATLDYGPRTPAAGPTRFSSGVAMPAGPIAFPEHTGRRTRRAWLAIPGLGLALAAAAAAWFAFAGLPPPEAPDDGPVAPAAALPADVPPPAAPEDVPAPAAADARPGADRPATVRMRFVSVPPGAEVTLDGARLGTSPCEAAVPAAPGPVEFAFRRAGWRPATVPAQPSEGAVVEARLERAAAPGPRAGDGPGPKPIDF